MELTSFIQGFDIQKLVGFLLILFRVSGLFLISPIFGHRSIPAVFQIALAILISILLLPYVRFTDARALGNDIYLVKLIIQEVSIGALIGFVAAILFGIFQAAGEIVSMKIGFSIAQVMDPSNEGASGILSTFYIIFGAIIFLYLNGHHLILGALVESFKVLPLGEGFSVVGTLGLTDLVMTMLAIGIQIAAPVIIVMTILNLIFGFLTKLSPQMNIYFNAGFIISPVVGLVIILLTLPLFRVVVSDWTGSFGPELLHFVRDLKGS